MRRSLKALLIAAAICIVCLAAGSGTAEAATKNGLITNKTTGKIYYYSKGKALKKQWKTLKVKGKTYKFYFGKNGAAYMAPSNMFGFYDVKLFQIGTKKYGFDNEGHLVAGGIYADSKSRLWAFTSTGKYNEKKTKSLRSKFRTFDVTHQVSRNLYKQVKKTFGKPKKVEKSGSCKPWNMTDHFQDIKLIYKHYEVQLIYDQDTGEYALNGFFSN